MSYGYVSQNSVSNAVVLRTGSVSVGRFTLINATAAATYLQIFDAADATTATITLGTTVPLHVVKAATSDPVNDDPTRELYFTTGVVVACTTTAVGATTATGHVRLWIL
jgi:hypothetical protein